VAQCQLPFSFKVVPKLPTTQGKRKRAQVEQRDLPAPDPPAVRRRIDGSNVLISRTGNEQIHHLAPDIDHQDASEDVQSCEDITPSSPLLTPPLDPRWSAGSTFARLDAIKPPNQAIAPPRTDGECAPTLTEVNPKTGSLTGGVPIWLQGTNFLSHLPLFARFGTAVVPTVSSLLRAKSFLIDHLRPSVTPTLFLVICLRRPPQGLSMLHYQSISSEMRLNMEPASRRSTT